MELFLNRVWATLASGITDVATTLPLTTGHGARFGTIGAGNKVRIVFLDTSGNVTEIAYMTAISGDNATITRGQDGTSGVAHIAGDRVEHRVGKSTMESLLQVAMIHEATSKGTPVDADELPLADSAASFGLKRLTWANLKAGLESIFAALAGSSSQPFSCSLVSITRASEPATPAAGDVWFNATLGIFQGCDCAAGLNTWASGGSLATARSDLAGAGSASDALSFGGNTGAPSAVTERYNGATWSAGGNLATARYILAGAGSASDALSFGGYTTTYVNTTERYNGATWSAGGNLATARYTLAGAGSASDALSFGGSTGAVSNITERYNGATWSAGGNLATARANLAGAGSASDALSFGGYTTTYANTTERYNGATWSAGGNLATARYSLAGAGSASDALSFGGSTGAVSNITERYNGATWSAGGNLATARYTLAGAGSASDALSFGGNAGALSAVTEKYTGFYVSNPAATRRIINFKF